MTILTGNRMTTSTQSGGKWRASLSYSLDKIVKVSLYASGIISYWLLMATSQPDFSIRIPFKPHRPTLTVPFHKCKIKEETLAMALIVGWSWKFWCRNLLEPPQDIGLVLQR